jgi:hypothetical protein
VMRPVHLDVDDLGAFHRRHGIDSGRRAR